jgi:aminodeoxyfutalosine deaminase
LTGAVAPGEPHPIGAFDAAGVLCTIDADDPALFSTTLIDEYALVGAELGAQALQRFSRNAVEASFASPERKASLNRELDAFDLETKPPRRR